LGYRASSGQVFIDAGTRPLNGRFRGTSKTPIAERKSSIKVIFYSDHHHDYTEAQRSPSLCRNQAAGPEHKSDERR
jgi:hypothetical protein